jgi:hypothetical protein
MNRLSAAPHQTANGAPLNAGGILQRKCDCGNHTVAGGKCAECSKKQMSLQRATQASESDTQNSGGVPPIVHDVLRSAGQPLDAQTRAFMEPRFGHDFSRVRVHTDARAAQSAQAVNALAYTLGRDIVFAAGHYSPRSSSGRLILAHELTHVVQQQGQSPIPGQPIALGGKDEHEHHADATALAVNRDLTPAGLNSRAGAAIMLLTPQKFRENLGATPDQKTAIDALFTNKTFLELWNYLRDCPAAPKKDLGALNLKVTPGLVIRGKERYGGYNPVTRTLEINPTKPEHKSNTAELIDTIVHELIHAVDDLTAECKKAGAKDPPLAGAATVSNAPSRADVAGKPEEKKLMDELGPGASNPCEEFIDINKAAQQIIIQVIKSNIEVAKVGRPTITFVNEILRTDPKALAEYEKCRKAACAKASEADRDKEIAACSANILSKFMPKSLKPKTTP